LGGGGEIRRNKEIKKEREKKTGFLVTDLLYQYFNKNSQEQ
jgi:hypothetical protein